MIIDPNDPRLALIPDQPGFIRPAARPLPGSPSNYFILRSRVQRSPDRQASIARRHLLAASGVMPPALAAHFTRGELAVYKIVADEFLAHGVCDLSRNAIAARAGVSHCLAERALLKAERQFQLISVIRRPRSGRKHLSNLTRITDAAWLTWLAHGNRKAKAMQSCNSARPDFQITRGVQNSPPRSQIDQTLQNGAVDNSGKIDKSARRWSRRTLF